MKMSPLALALGLATLALTSPAQADTSVELRVSGPVIFLDTTPTCEVAKAWTPLYFDDHRRAGALHVCYQTYVSGDGYQAFQGTASFDLRDGTVRVDISNVEDFVTDDLVESSWVGEITGGTGRYDDASGSLTGGGPIAFKPGGPRPDLNFSLSLD